MLSFSTSGKGSILLYPFRSSPLLAITFLYHPKDFFLYRAAAPFEYPLIKRNQRATVINFKNHANLFFASAAFFAPVILSRIRYPTAPVCKNVQSQNCELLTTLENITNLQYRMISDYAERVQRLQRGSCTSKLMIDVVNYIRHHISEPITVEKMAEALFMSRPYLSRKFKEETGESLTDFILYEKTEEAKRLLRYSDKPITAISSYLGFSSPSHFSRVFKARVCITPGEYREKHQ